MLSNPKPAVLFGSYSHAVASRNDDELDELMASALGFIGESGHLGNARIIRELRAISSDPTVLARAAGHLLGEFLRDPLTHPRGLQAAALLDEAGAGRETQAVVVEALNVRTRLGRNMGRSGLQTD